MQKQDLHKQVALAQAGNKKALEIVCRELQGEVKSTLSRIIEDPVLVEDLSLYQDLDKSDLGNITLKERSELAKMLLRCIKS